MIKSVSAEPSKCRTWDILGFFSMSWRGHSNVHCFRSRIKLHPHRIRLNAIAIVIKERRGINWRAINFHEQLQFSVRTIPAYAVMIIWHRRCCSDVQYVTNPFTEDIHHGLFAYSHRWPDHSRDCVSHEGSLDLVADYWVRQSEIYDLWSADSDPWPSWVESCFRFIQLMSCNWDLTGGVTWKTFFWLP